ncbi:uncharacterized protein TNCV_4620771 [Trichonephila clavipes]|nr:uncharacterized protein TNCV_4620771 [Trichonephila clavipes]
MKSCTNKSLDDSLRISKLHYPSERFPLNLVNYRKNIENNFPVVCFTDGSKINKIYGNGRADWLAKEATKLSDLSPMRIPKSYYKNVSMLAKNFKKYFLDEDSLVASYEWIKDLFQDTPEGLSTSEEEIFIDFTSSEKLKGNFVINRSLNLG